MGYSNQISPQSKATSIPVANPDMNGPRRQRGGNRPQARNQGAAERRKPPQNTPPRFQQPNRLSYAAVAQGLKSENQQVSQANQSSQNCEPTPQHQGLEQQQMGQQHMHQQEMAPNQAQQQEHMRHMHYQQVQQQQQRQRQDQRQRQRHEQQFRQQRWHQQPPPAMPFMQPQQVAMGPYYEPPQFYPFHQISQVGYMPQNGILAGPNQFLPPPPPPMMNPMQPYMMPVNNMVRPPPGFESSMPIVEQPAVSQYDAAFGVNPSFVNCSFNQHIALDGSVYPPIPMQPFPLFIPSEKMPNKRRPKAIAIIDPSTGVDKLNEIYGSEAKENE